MRRHSSKGAHSDHEKKVLALTALAVRRALAALTRAASAGTTLQGSTKAFSVFSWANVTSPRSNTGAGHASQSCRRTPNQDITTMESPCERCAAQATADLGGVACAFARILEGAAAYASATAKTQIKPERFLRISGEV